MKNLIILLALLGLTACATGPDHETPIPIAPIKTMQGYTIDQAKVEMALTPNPYDISLSACYTENGYLIPELNQLRMRFQNDFSHRAGKQFIMQYNHRTLYPRLGQ